MPPNHLPNIHLLNHPATQPHKRPLMFEKIKRSLVGRSRLGPEPEVPESYTQYEQMQQQLENVEHALTSTMQIIGARAGQTEIANSAVQFSECLHTLYPADDDLRQLFGTTMDDSIKLRDALLPNEAENSNLQEINRMVNGYLEGIRTLKLEYPKIEAARRRFHAAQRKVNRNRYRESDDPKKVRVLLMQDRTWATYSSVLEDTLNRMKTTYTKSSTMFRATFVAYWIIQRRMTETMSTHFQNAFKYAEDNSSDVFAITRINTSKWE